MSRPVSALRLSFQAKVLAPVLAFLVLMPLVTLWIINHEISQQARSDANQTLTTADAVFRNSLDIFGRGLATRFRGVVNEPRFKAVAQLGDAKTMTDFLRDSLDEFGREIELVTYSIEPDALFAGANRQAQVDFDTFLAATAELSQDAFNGEVGTGTVFAAGRPYSVVAVPVFSIDRLSVTGVLTIGLHFGNQSLEELKSLTRTDIVIFVSGQVSAATLAHHWPTSLIEVSPGENRAGPNPSIPLEVEGEHFLALAGDYRAAEGRPGFHYLLLSSYEARLQALRNTQLMLAGASLLGILVSASSVWVLIRRITQPLRALRDSAEAVGKGDFTQRIEQYSRDECGELAGAFNAMTSNLLTSRNDLERTVATLRATDARLRESEEQLRLTIESAQDHMICTLDRRGQVQRWNAAAERLLGHTAAEAQGLPYRTFFADDERAAGLPERLLAVAGAAGREAFEGWRVRRDGTRFWAEITLSRLPDDAGFVEIARDSTLRREADQALRTARDAAESANRAKTEFIANMSHELRTPMNAIIGMSSLLLDDRLSEETRDCIHIIRTNADALLETIDDILDVSKFEAGQFDLTHQPFDLCGCIEEVVDQFAVRFSERNIDLAVHLGRDLPAIVVGDRARLGQVLGNLVSNALKFTERGGVILSLSTQKSATGEDRLLFSVEDTGIGIPANRVDRLFKMFSQVDASSTRRFGGTGLGLAIAQRLVEIMQGTIAVESEVGRGSRFYFSIATSIEPPRAAPEFSGFEGRSMVVVGTDNITTLCLRQQLATWGATVTGHTVWEGAGQTFDVVVLAEDAAADLPRSSDRRAPVIQLVHLSADRTGPATAGKINLPKPVKPRALYTAVRKVLDATRSPKTTPSFPVLTADFEQRHPLRILLAEDNPVNARVAQLLLKRLGYDSDWAIDGRKALERMEHQTYDVVLMDLQMPEIDGLEVTRTFLSTTHPDHQPYIIALTANVRKDDRDACAAAGMNDFMGKPVQLDKLAAGLERAHTWILERKVRSAWDQVQRI